MSTVAQFTGAVRTRREDAPLGLTLEGHSVEAPSQEISLAFAFARGTPPPIPAALRDALIERVPTELCADGERGDARGGTDAKCFRVSSGQDQWIFRAVDCHLHREVSELFYRAIPPRPAPWSKRIFLRLVLILAAHPAGRRLLRALRRR